VSALEQKTHSPFESVVCEVNRKVHLIQGYFPSNPQVEMSRLLNRLWRSRPGESKSETQEREQRLMTAPVASSSAAAAASSSESKYDKETPKDDDDDSESMPPPPPPRRQRLDETGSSRPVAAAAASSSVDRDYGTHDTDVVGEEDVLSAQLGKVYDDFYAFVHNEGRVTHDVLMPPLEVIGHARFEFSSILQRLKPLLKRALETRLKANRERNLSLVHDLQRSNMVVLKSTLSKGTWRQHLATLVNLRGKALHPDKTTIGGLLSELQSWKPDKDIEPEVRKLVDGFAEAYRGFCDMVMDRRTKNALRQVLPPDNGQTDGGVLKTIRWNSPMTHPWINSLQDSKRRLLFKTFDWADPSFFQSLIRDTIKDIPDTVDLELIDYMNAARDRLVEKGFRDMLPVVYEQARLASIEGWKALRLQETIDQTYEYSQSCINLLDQAIGEHVILPMVDTASQKEARRLIRRCVQTLQTQSMDDRDWKALQQDPSALTQALADPPRLLTMDGEEGEVTDEKTSVDDLTIVASIQAIRDMADHEDLWPKWKAAPLWTNWHTLGLVQDKDPVQLFWHHLSSASWQPCDALRSAFKRSLFRVDLVRHEVRSILLDALQKHSTVTSFCKALSEADDEDLELPVVDDWVNKLRYRVSVWLNLLMGGGVETQGDLNTLRTCLNRFLSIREDEVWMSDDHIALSSLSKIESLLKPVRGTDLLAMKLPKPKDEQKRSNEVSMSLPPLVLDASVLFDKMVPFEPSEQPIEMELPNRRRMIQAWIQSNPNGDVKERVLFGCLAMSLDRLMEYSDDRAIVPASPQLDWTECIDRLARAYTVDAVHSLPIDLSEQWS
jgi:hypothetical protein